MAFHRHLNTTVEQAASNNSTLTLIRQITLDKAQAVRLGQIGLGALSLGLAAIIIIRIFYDAMRAKKLQVTLRPQKFAIIKTIHPADTFSLAVNVASVAQQIVYIIIETTALQTVFVQGCGGTAQIVFPVIFLVAYTHFVFGIETTVRSLRRPRFAPRGKWNTPICIAVILVLMLLTWVPTTISRDRRFCFGKIVLFVVHFNIIAITILIVLLLSFLLMASVIGIQLARNVNVDPSERIAASRMFYYLLFGTAIPTFIIPFFIQAHLGNFNGSHATSRLAEMMLFSQGIFTAFFHLFLRSNAGRLIIMPVGTPWSARRRFRLFGPNDLECLNISEPVRAMSTSSSNDSFIQSEEEKKALADSYMWRREKAQPLVRDFSTPGSVVSASRATLQVDPTEWPLPPDSLPNPDRPASIQLLGHKRNQSSYSLFPTRAEDIPRLPASVYTPPRSSRLKPLSKPTSAVTDTSITLHPMMTTSGNKLAEGSLLKAPTPLFDSKHRRGSSSGSSATVQIGLRLSVAPATIAAGNSSAMNRLIRPPPSSLRREMSDASGESILLPIQVPTTDEPKLLGASTAVRSPDIARNKLLPPTPQSTSGLGMDPLSVNPPGGIPVTTSMGRGSRTKPGPGWI